MAPLIYTARSCVSLIKSSERIDEIDNESHETNPVYPKGRGRLSTTDTLLPHLLNYVGTGWSIRLGGDLLFHRFVWNLLDTNDTQLASLLLSVLILNNVA